MHQHIHAERNAREKPKTPDCARDLPILPAGSTCNDLQGNAQKLKYQHYVHPKPNPFNGKQTFFQVADRDLQLNNW